MSLIDHPNVIKSYCSFAVDHKLWVVMPFMAQGSCFHLMKAAYPDGFEEPAICCILKETLKALDYLHRHGHIHRDVKSGNILLDDTGEIKLGDFGVSACLFENGDWQRSRNTFVGTPCWLVIVVFLQSGIIKLHTLLSTRPFTCNFSFLFVGWHRKSCSQEVDTIPSKFLCFSAWSLCR